MALPGRLLDLTPLVRTEQAEALEKLVDRVAWRTARGTAHFLDWNKNV